MDTGREWTRRSIEELIEARLKKYKGGSQGKIFMVEEAAFAPGVDYQWGFVNGSLIYDWVEDAGFEFPGHTQMTGPYQMTPVIGSLYQGNYRAYFIEMPCTITDTSIDDGFTSSTFYQNMGGWAINYAWAYDQRTNELFRLKYRGDYDLTHASNQLHLLDVTDWASVNVSVLSQTLPLYYATVSSFSQQGFKLVRDKLVNYRDTGLKVLFLIGTGIHLDDDTIKAYIKYRSLGLINLHSVSDIDLSQI